MRTAVLLGFRLRQEVLEWSGAWWFLLTLVVQAVVAPLIGLFVWSAVSRLDSSDFMPLQDDVRTSRQNRILRMDSPRR